MDAEAINALIQGLGPFGAVIALAAYAVWTKPKPGTLANPVSPEYERGMVAAMAAAAEALQTIAGSLDKIERQIAMLVDRRRS